MGVSDILEIRKVRGLDEFVEIGPQIQRSTLFIGERHVDGPAGEMGGGLQI